jgi:outer membrane receptor protein involved in Fe transport
MAEAAHPARRGVASAVPEDLDRPAVSLGVRLSADWKSATTVRGGSASAFQTLQFSDVGTVDLSVFEMFGPQQPAWRRFPFLRGARMTLSIKNLFDTRERVRDAAGSTPPVYQGPYLDPLGRTVSLSFRKLLP